MEQQCSPRVDILPQEYMDQLSKLQWSMKFYLPQSDYICIYDDWSLNEHR
ncbi:hypothetical protein EJB05_36883, partial [Eragrostis curvula]